MYAFLYKVQLAGLKENLFFRMSMKELLESKHPTAWVEFEEGQIDEVCIEIVK